MITDKELELFEKKMHDKEHRLTQGGRILTEMVRQIKDSTQSIKNDIDNWGDYSAYSDWDRGR